MAPEPEIGVGQHFLGIVTSGVMSHVPVTMWHCPPPHDMLDKLHVLSMLLHSKIVPCALWPNWELLMAFDHTTNEEMVTSPRDGQTLNSYWSSYWFIFSSVTQGSQSTTANTDVMHLGSHFHKILQKVLEFETPPLHTSTCPPCPESMWHKTPIGRCCHHPWLLLPFSCPAPTIVTLFISCT